MNPACQQHRTDLPEGPDGRLDLAGLTASSGHAAECAECAAWAQGLVRLGESLYALPRQDAPAQLDGLVVATLQAGAREARAVRAVEGLSRMHSPETLAESLEEELDEPVDGPLVATSSRGERVGAPSVLERLVREELAEPEKSTVRRVLGGLPRLEAPAELDARVRDDLVRPEPTPVRPRFALLRGKHVGWASAAAAVLLLVGPFGLGGLRDEAPVEDTPVARERSFEVVYARSLQDLDPVARTLVDGVSGGLLTAKGL